MVFRKSKKQSKNYKTEICTNKLKYQHQKNLSKLCKIIKIKRYLVETFLHPSWSHEHFAPLDWHLGASLTGFTPGARNTSWKKYFLVSSAVRMFWQDPVALAHSNGSNFPLPSAIDKMIFRSKILRASIFGKAEITRSTC